MWEEGEEWVEEVVEGAEVEVEEVEVEDPQLAGVLVPSALEGALSGLRRVVVELPRPLLSLLANHLQDVLLVEAQEIMFTGRGKASSVQMFSEKANFPSVLMVAGTLV